MDCSPAPRRVTIAPSLLSADFLALGRDVGLIARGRPDWLHVDVMDGHFVPNLTVGPAVVQALRAATDVPLDVHLMVSNPERQLDWFIEAGADLLTVHLECAGLAERPEEAATGGSVAVSEATHPERLEALLGRIRAAGRLAGLSINPGTPAEAALPFLSQLDCVLVMSVHPGFGGQAFMPVALDKLRLLSQAAACHPGLLLEVDGGINAETAPLAVAAGANMLVAGNAVFGAADPVAALAELRAAAEGAAWD